MDIILPEGKTLLPFQREAVKKAIKFLTSPVRGCYNGCEMGLGKTIQTIAILNTYLHYAHKKSSINVLIICPSVMTFTWRNELKEWLSLPANWWETCSILSSSKDFKVDGPLNSFCITSYGLASQPKNLAKLIQTKWDFLILDEAHYVKNPKAKRTQAILDVVWSRANYHIALSGTPFLRNCIDGFTLFNKFTPKFFPTFMDYAYRYTHVRKSPFHRGLDYRGVKNEEELHRIIYSQFFFRYTKDEVLKDLPDKIFQTIELDEKEFALKFSPEEKAALEKYHEEVLRYLRDERAMPPVTPAPVATVRRKQALLKIKPIVEVCKEYLDAGVPIVLFLIHTELIEKIKIELKRYKPVVIQGSTSGADRNRAIETFQSEGSNLLIGQIHTAGVGITLHRASTVLFGEPDYSPSVVSQAIARVHRYGQKNSVLAVFIVVKNSIDSKVVKRLVSKLNDFEKVLDGKRESEERNTSNSAPATRNIQSYDC